jgi:hypothetical protein
MLPFPPKQDRNILRSQIDKESLQRVRKEVRRQNVVTFILFIIFIYQLVSLPGAIMMQSPLAIGTVIFGIALCGLAMIFNRMGKVGIVSILLILVVDLGCGLMLLTPGMDMASMSSMPSSGSMSSTSSMPSSGSMHSTNTMPSMENSSTAKLDVSELPTFDLLVVSELIAASLLAPASIFIVAVSNVLFIIGMVTFMPHTAELDMLLKSSMAYNTLSQPIILQIVVAAITYMWVSSALRAALRADRAEEIAALQQAKAMLQEREVEQKRLIETGVNELLQGLSQGVNGKETTINLKQDHMLWKVGNAVNLLLTRLRRTRQIDQENQQLRAQVVQMRERLLEAKFTGMQDAQDPSKQKRGYSLPGF